MILIKEGSSKRRKAETMSTTYEQMTALISNTGFQVISQSALSVVIARDDARPFELALLQRKAEQMGVAYETVGARVISRRRVGRGVYEQVDHSTYTGIRFVF